MPVGAGQKRFSVFTDGMTLDMAVFDDKISIDAAVAEAARLEQSGDYDAALTIYENLHQRHPTDIDLKYRTGTAMLRVGRLEEAIPVLRQVVFNDPDHTKARSNLGNAHLLLEQYDYATEAFRAVLDFDPKNKNALFGLATILIRQNRHGEALPLAQRLVNELPNSPAALTIAADAGSLYPQLDVAIARYRQALRIDSDYVPAYLGLGRALQQRKRSKEAYDCACAVIERQPFNPAGHDLKGAILAEMQDYEAAETAYLQALEIAPDDVRILIHLTEAARKAGKARRALIYAERAWTLDQTNKHAGKALGSTLSALGKNSLAREILLTGGARADVRAETLVKVRKLAEEIRNSAGEEGIIPTVAQPAREPETPSHIHGDEDNQPPSNGGNDYEADTSPDRLEHDDSQPLAEDDELAQRRG
ncbi:tetratricopeptide repeat protein [Stappia sp. GBMRC 2046]|uniref:Tetratricopeptide repeat protein n=1 Tax=Stappia sediminis TaxID=2692190 RepID=A0A7X3LSQ6_9HYPH|nr:tetratricopeptide repeat protein [Stappia sediminis]MXN64422.1 tetratricopeptide repeat protein [Stappia sediminis]